jgi:hypothetical protein
LRGENSDFSLKCKKETENKKKGQQHSHIETIILKRGIFVVPVDGISRFFGRMKKYSQIIKKNI